jgi:hypothetical protein
VPGQLAGRLSDDNSGAGLVVSASKELEPGARAMLLLAEGLFRLDVVIRGDTLQTIVRNLSNGELEMDGRHDRPAGLHVAIGEVAAYEPASVSVDFALGSPGDRVEVKVLIATLRFGERGTVRVTAQAVIRKALLS